MNHASLFSGIGGFDLASEWAGWNNVLSCEIDPFCNKVLQYHFPNAVHIGDIKEAKFKRDDRGNVWIQRYGVTENTMQGGCLQREFIKERAEVWEQRNISAGNTDGIYNEPQEETWQNLGPIDIISGGFPCQPFSLAGKRRGSEDDRHLWPEMLRAIREIQPRWIVGENVFGLTNWSGGVVFREVLSDLENEGYEVQPFIIPACAVNAPHRRDRVWIVAYATNGRKWELQPVKPGDNSSEIGMQDSRYIGCSSQNGAAADTERKRMEIRDAESVRNGSHPAIKRYNSISDWTNFPTQPPLRSRDDGVPGRLDGISVSKLRNESIKAYGNAIVPNVAYEIFKAINEYEKLKL